MLRRSLFILALPIILVRPIDHVWADEGGYSNYVPSFYGDFALAVAPPDGLTMRSDFYYYSADVGSSIRSGQIETNIDISFAYNYTTLLYKPGVKIFGAEYGFAATTAIGRVDIDAEINVGNRVIAVRDDQTGLGDLTLTPVALWWNRGNFHFAWSNYIVVPIGSYDVDRIANASLNYWTYETDFMTTYFNPETGQDYSLVVGYGYNFENADTDYKSGDEIHVDYVINQFLSESFAVGITGYYFKQIGGDSGDGAVFGDFKAESAGIGPAILWNTTIGDQDISFIAKWVHEYHAKRRLKGDHFFVSLAMSF